MPGCVVTDAEGSRANNLEGHSLASEALAGLNARGAGEGGGCKLMDSAKVSLRASACGRASVKSMQIDIELDRSVSATRCAC